MDSTRLVSIGRSNNSGAIGVKMDGSVLEEKSSFKTLGLSFSSKLVWVSYIVSIAKTESKTNGFLFRSIKSLSTKVGLYLYKFIIPSCKENCSHIWGGAPRCYLDTLDEQQERVCRTFGLSLSAFL